MNIRYVVPSYRRYDGLTTLDYIGKAEVFVSRSDYPKYIERNEGRKGNFHMMPDEYQGRGKAVAMNWILDEVWDDSTDAVVMLDDDIERVMLWRSEGRDVALDEDDVYEVCGNLALLAKEWGCGMFAMGTGGADRLMHKPFEPFKLHSCGSGQFLGFVRNDGIRFDERLLTSEDYDIQLQSIARYHKLLKVDRYYLKVRQWTNEGGYQAIRKGRSTDRKYRDMLMEKWGANIVRINAKQRGDVGYSIHVPLKGV